MSWAARLPGQLRRTFLLQLTTIWKWPLLIVDLDKSMTKARMDWSTALRALLYSTVRGAIFGLAICFFFMLRLGLLGQPELTGYVVSLFFIAGAQAGALAGMLRFSIEVYKAKARKQDSSLPRSQPSTNTTKEGSKMSG